MTLIKPTLSVSDERKVGYRILEHSSCCCCLLSATPHWCCLLACLVDWLRAHARYVQLSFVVMFLSFFSPPMNLCELKEYSWERGRFLSPPRPLMLAFLREIKSKVTNQLTWMNMRMWLLFPSKLVDHNEKVPKNFYWSPIELLAIIFLIMYIKMNCWCANANHFGHKISLSRPFFFFLSFFILWEGKWWTRCHPTSYPSF